MKESAIPANAMGASSSTPGTGAIDLFDPLLFQRTKKLARRAARAMKQRAKEKKNARSTKTSR